MVLRAGEMVGTHRVGYVIRPSFWVVEQLGTTGSLSRRFLAKKKESEEEPGALLLTVKLHLVKWSPTVN